MLPSLHPHALNSTQTQLARLFAGAHISAAFSPQRSKTQTRVSFAPPCRRTVHIAGQKQRKSKPSDMGGHTGVNSPAGGSKKLISLDLKERTILGASLAQQHPQQTLRRVNRGRTEKCLPLCGEHNQLTGRSSKCLGNLSGGDERRREEEHSQ